MTSPISQSTRSYMPLLKRS